MNKWGLIDQDILVGIGKSTTRFKFKSSLDCRSRKVSTFHSQHILSSHLPPLHFHYITVN